MRWIQKSRTRPAAATGWGDVRDEVTGLATRASFVHHCTDALAWQDRQGAPAQVAVLLIDLYGITEAIEAGGRGAGEELLRRLATRISREVGSSGLLACTADHELGVLFEDLTEPAVALDLAYRVVTAVGSPVVLPSQRQVLVAATCGLVTRETLREPVTAADLVRGAGLALREARRAGPNNIEVCTPELLATAEETMAIGKDLRQALQDKGLGVCYQPLVDLSSGAILGFEALVRWSHPVRGHVPPARFVPVAEELGLISELGRMVLETASAQIQQWSLTFGQPVNAHVNISGQDLVHEHFLTMVDEVLAGSGLPPNQLVLEVTEAILEPSFETARRRFDALHERGVRVALDDFGTGRSGLSYLEWLSVDILKVDQSYLETIDSQQTDDIHGDNALRGVIDFAHALGVTVYGEGIEDEAQRERLLRNGCDMGQGYLFARPLAADEAVVLLRSAARTTSPLASRILAAESADTA